MNIFDFIKNIFATEMLDTFIFKCPKCEELLYSKTYDIEEVIVKKTYSHQPLFEKNFYKNTFRDPFNDDKVFLCLSVCLAFCASAIHAVSILIHFIK